MRPLGGLRGASMPLVADVAGVARGHPGLVEADASAWQFAQSSFSFET
jgi:hypothetical protein